MLQTCYLLSIIKYYGAFYLAVNVFLSFKKNKKMTWTSLHVHRGKHPTAEFRGSNSKTRRTHGTKNQKTNCLFYDWITAAVIWRITHPLQPGRYHASLMLASQQPQQSNGCRSSSRDDISTLSRWNGAMNDHRSAFTNLTSAPALCSSALTPPAVVPSDTGPLRTKGAHSRTSVLFSGLGVHKNCARIEDG